jgi:hypothetical protein
MLPEGIKLFRSSGMREKSGSNNQEYYLLVSGFNRHSPHLTNGGHRRATAVDKRKGTGK